jgi:hypothetical protein
MNKKRLFFDFLQKHNALEAYKRAFKASILGSDLRTVEYVPLACSFIWHETPEGHEYWRLLDEKWCDYYQSIKKKCHF